MYLNLAIDRFKCNSTCEITGHWEWSCWGWTHNGGKHYKDIKFHNLIHAEKKHVKPALVAEWVKPPAVAHAGQGSLPAWVEAWVLPLRVIGLLARVHAIGLFLDRHRGFICVLFKMWQVAAAKFRESCSAAVSAVSGILILQVDPEIDRIHRSTRSFDVGVELSQKSRRKLSWSIESVVRLWSRVSRFSAVKSTFLTPNLHIQNSNKSQYSFNDTKVWIFCAFGLKTSISGIRPLMGAVSTQSSNGISMCRNLSYGVGL